MGKCEEFISAIILGDLNTIKILLKDAEIIKNINKPFGNYNWTFLHFAALYQRVDVIKMLVESKAKINQVDTLGNTALHIAVRNKHIYAAKELLFLSADFKICNTDGLAPIHVAISTRNIHLVEVFLNYGDDVDRLIRDRWLSIIFRIRELAELGTEDCKNIIEFLIGNGATLPDRLPPGDDLPKHIYQQMHKKLDEYRKNQKQLLRDNIRALIYKLGEQIPQETQRYILDKIKQSSTKVAELRLIVKGLHITEPQIQKTSSAYTYFKLSIRHKEQNESIGERTLLLK